MLRAIIRHLLFSTGLPVVLCFTLLIVAAFLTDYLNHDQ